MRFSCPVAFIFSHFNHFMPKSTNTELNIHISVYLLNVRISYAADIMSYTNHISIIARLYCHHLNNLHLQKTV